MPCSHSATSTVQPSELDSGWDSGHSGAGVKVIAYKVKVTVSAHMTMQVPVLFRSN